LPRTFRAWSLAPRILSRSFGNQNNGFSAPAFSETIPAQKPKPPLAENGIEVVASSSASESAWRRIDHSLALSCGPKKKKRMGPTAGLEPLDTAGGRSGPRQRDFACGGDSRSGFGETTMSPCMPPANGSTDRNGPSRPLSRAGKSHSPPIPEIHLMEPQEGLIGGTDTLFTENNPKSILRVPLFEIRPGPKEKNAMNFRGNVRWALGGTIFQRPPAKDQTAYAGRASLAMGGRGDFFSAAGNRTLGKIFLEESSGGREASPARPQLHEMR